MKRKWLKMLKNSYFNTNTFLSFLGTKTETTLILDAIAIPELHLYLGIFTSIFDNLNQGLKALTEEKYSAFDWTDAKSITQTNRKSGKFDGGHVKILLNSLDTLDLILIEAKAVDEFELNTIAFKSFKFVTDKCFGKN